MSTPPPSELPERRKTPLVQRITLAVDVGIFVALLSYAFWNGRQSERLDKVIQQQAQQGEAMDALQRSVTDVTGQVLAAAEGRIAVVEAKGASTETLVRDLKVDMTDRLRRIEDKIDDKK